MSKNKKIISIIISIFVLIIVLAGMFSWSFMNPNPGERTADNLWNINNDYPGALGIITKEAHSGFPWAELRLGIMNELGIGVEKNNTSALYWYKQASIQMKNNRWYDGQLFSFGKLGYFNSNGDALIAQHRISSIIAQDQNATKEELAEAYLLEKHVIEASRGYDIFYCCASIGGRYITSKEISENFSKISSQLSESEMKLAEDSYDEWVLKNFPNYKVR